MKETDEMKVYKIIKLVLLLVGLLLIVIALLVPGLTSITIVKDANAREFEDAREVYYWIMQHPSFKPAITAFFDLTFIAIFLFVLRSAVFTSLYKIRKEQNAGSEEKEEPVFERKEEALSNE